MLDLKTEYDINYDVKIHRLRCQGHIINLAVHSFLFVTDSDNIEDNNMSTNTPATLEEIQDWRRYGPLGKLHNFVVYIQASPQRLQAFKKLSHGRHPLRDNKTRWNSWEKMIRAATTSPVFDGIQSYFQHHSVPEIESDQLTDTDWETLRKIHSFLYDLTNTTNALQSNQSTLDYVLPAMDFILGRFEKIKEDYNSDEILGPMANSGWRKMDKYYNRTDESPAYIAALVLNPEFKWDYIQSQWRSDWIPKAKKTMTDYWQKEYKPTVPSITTLTEPTTLVGNSYTDWRRTIAAKPDIDDEYTHYINTAVVVCKDARSWWMEPTQQSNYPNLSIMALDILSIPSMSAEPERLFSGTKLLISDRRIRLGADLIEAFSCLKSWYKLKSWDEVDINPETFN